MKEDSDTKGGAGELARQLARLTPAQRTLLEEKLLADTLAKTEVPKASPYPEITRDPSSRHLPFPLTLIQEAYWVGRNSDFELGDTATHIYLEYDAGHLDPERLEAAWNRLVARHEMLRAVILPDGRQEIREQVEPYRFRCNDLSARSQTQAESALEKIRREVAYQVLPIGRWPMFEIGWTRLAGGRARLHLYFDTLILDGRSRYILFREWYRLYENPEADLPALDLSFRDYVLALSGLKDTEDYARARAYWMQRLSSLPEAPELPQTEPTGTRTRGNFIEIRNHVPPDRWNTLKKRISRAGITPSVFLLAVFAEVLRTWSRKPAFTLNLTHFNRLPAHAQVEDIVGDFTSLILLEVGGADLPTFEARAQKIQEQLWNDMDHQLFSGVELLREMARSRPGLPRAQMPVVFTSLLVHDIASGRASPSGWMGDLVFSISETPQVHLDLVVSEETEGLRLRWNMKKGHFPKSLAGDLSEANMALIDRLLGEEDAWRASAPEISRWLLPAEQASLFAAVNATAAAESEALLHTLFAAQARRQPDRPAVIAPDRALRYGELDRLANRIGRCLRHYGARPDTLVAVVMDRGWAQAAAVMGILAAGAAYLPISPDLPRQRRHFLLTSARVETVLTRPEPDRDLSWPKGIRRLVVREGAFDAFDDTPLAPVQTPDNLAYVIFTSGSTGRPKGVMIDHRGAVNTVLDINRRFGLSPQDRAIALSALDFDLSVYDIFGPLAAGGALVVPDPAEVRDPSRWFALLTQHRVTVWNSVPALAGLLAEYAEGRGGGLPECLRLVMMSGDWIPVTLPGRLRSLGGDIVQVSLGGATEASIWSIGYSITEVDPAWKSIPYGKPLANQRFYVLREDLTPCPVWVTGQLYIGGIGLARGYWDDPEKTAASFIFHPRTGERLYATGDLGRYRPDGNIEFLGREDFQVKVQGYRVETGEIEAALLRHPAIDGAAVIVSGDRDREKRLCAYFVSRQQPPPTPVVLRQYLADSLPGYMVPTRFVPLDALPLTANGKVDLRALPDPSAGDLQASVAAGRSRSEAEIAAMVAGILELERVEPQADLLGLGATSIHMIRIANRMEQAFGTRPDINTFYNEPTVAALSRLCAPTAEESAPEADASLPPEGVVILRDPARRDAFKATEPGLRRERKGERITILAGAETEADLRRACLRRRSHRTFFPEPIAAHAFGGLLAVLRRVQLDGTTKYRYASAGGLYPVQAYVYAKQQRIEGVEAGVHYYRPSTHRLERTSAEPALDPKVFDPFINRPIFEQAAFAIFLVAQMKAIWPMYGRRSLHYATIEAGLISQLLEERAPDFGIGLCQIGDLDFARIRHRFDLDDGHRPVHFLLGGRIATEKENARKTGDRGIDLEEREEGEI